MGVANRRSSVVQKCLDALVYMNISMSIGLCNGLPLQCMYVGFHQVRPVLCGACLD